MREVDRIAGPPSMHSTSPPQGLDPDPEDCDCSQLVRQVRRRSDEEQNLLAAPQQAAVGALWSPALQQHSTPSAALAPTPCNTGATGAARNRSPLCSLCYSHGPCSAARAVRRTA
jgi:hypothetical protein